MAPICFCGFPLLQCLSSVILAGSPFPSHPTGRSVFPNPAVRQSSSHSMHRLTRVLDDSAPDVDHPSGVQSRIRVFLPPEASTFMAKVQVTAKASVDESLQAAKCLARVVYGVDDFLPGLLANYEMTQRSNPALLETCKPEKPSKAALLNRTSAQRIPSRPGACAPTKAEYICADQPVTFIFRLRQSGGPYIPVCP